MKCDSIRAKLPLYAEGDLGESAMRAIDGHLGACADCRGELEGVFESQRALKALRSVSVDADALQAMRARVLERIVVAHVEAGLRRRTASVALAAAALVVTSSVATLWVTSPRNSSPRGSVAPRADEEAKPAAGSEIAEPVVIKWVTNNPKVEVYLISEAREGGNGPAAA